MISKFIERVNEIRETIFSCTTFYVYGAGSVAQQFCDILQKYDIIPAAFVVSDGYKKQDKLSNIPILEISEVLNQKDRCAFFAMHDSEECYEKYKDKFKISRILDDTKDLCSLYALKTIEDLENKEINLDEEYMTIKEMVMLNPFHTDWSYCWAWLSEYMDLIYPALLNDFSLVDEGPYEHDHVCVKKGDIVIDCGANIGLFSAYASYKGAFVYAFEPVQHVQEYLKKTVGDT